MKNLLISLLVLLSITGCYKSPFLHHTPKTEAKKGCEMNDAIQCYSLGLKYMIGSHDTKKDYLKAKKYFLKTCELDAGLGYYGLARLYHVRGYEFPKDWKSDLPKARKYYHKACESNSPRGCHIMAEMYMYGFHGVKKNYSKAEKYLLKGCEVNSRRSCLRLAFLYKSGKPGIKQDSLKSKKYFQKACASGNYSDLKECQ